jgi:hypothetical protein
MTVRAWWFFAVVVLGLWFDVLVWFSQRDRWPYQ